MELHHRPLRYERNELLLLHTAILLFSPTKQQKGVFSTSQPFGIRVKQMFCRLLLLSANRISEP